MTRTVPKLSPKALQMLEDVYGDDVLAADDRDPDDLMLSTAVSVLLQWYKEFAIEEQQKLHRQIADLKQEVERLQGRGDRAAQPDAVQEAGGSGRTAGVNYNGEQSHEYLAPAVGDACKLCLRSKKHPIHELPRPDPDMERADDWPRGALS